MTDGYQRWIRCFVRLARIGELSVIMSELAMIQACFKRDRAAHVFWNLHAVMRYIGCTRRDQTDIQETPGLPRIALVDRIAFAVELIRTVEMGTRFHRAFSVVL